MKYMRSYSYNVDVAKIFGIFPSILLSYLDSMANLQKANGEYEGQLRIARKDICEETALTDEDLLNAEKVLSGIDILSMSDVRNSQKISYSVNEKRLREVLLTGVSIIDISKQTKTEKKPKRKSQKEVAKLAINFGDENVDNKLKEWLASLYEVGKGGLSKASLEMQQNDLKKFSQGNNDVAIEVLNIAIKNTYRNLEWAIKRYTDIKGKNNSYNFSDYESIRSDGEDRSEEVF